MHFFPAEQKFPARVDTLDFFIVGPHGFHLSEIERFKGGIKARVRETESVFWSLFVLRGLGGHGKGGTWDQKSNSNLSQSSYRGSDRPLAPGERAAIPVFGARKFQATDYRHDSPHLDCFARQKRQGAEAQGFGPSEMHGLRQPSATAGENYYFADHQREKKFCDV